MCQARISVLQIPQLYEVGTHLLSWYLRDRKYGDIHGTCLTSPS